jgi:hypothetical protein
VKVIATTAVALVLALGLAAPAFAGTTTTRHETTTTGWSRNKSGEHVFTVVHIIVITKVDTVTKTVTVPGPTVYTFPSVCQQAMREYNDPNEAVQFVNDEYACSNLMYPFPPVGGPTPIVVPIPALGRTISRHETTTAGWSVNKHGVHVLTVVHTMTLNRVITNTVVHTVQGPTVYAYPPVCQNAVDLNQQWNNSNGSDINLLVNVQNAQVACMNYMYP